MKSLFFLLSFFSINLYAQQGGFKAIVPFEKQAFPSQIIELSNKNYLCVVSSFYDNSVRNKTKLVVFSPKGIALDSMILSAPDADMNIYKAVATNYGVCLIGVMKKDTNNSFLVVNLNKQLQVINQQFKPMPSGEVYDIGYAIDGDSTIILQFRYKRDIILVSTHAKINKQGEIIKLKNIVATGTIPFSSGIVVRKDSAMYNFIYPTGYWVCDTSFNNWRLYFMNIPNEIRLRNPYATEAVIKNDSTFLFAGECYRASYLTNAFFAVIKNYQYTNYRETAVGGDTLFFTTFKKGIDTTKDGRFIYVGGTYNAQFSIFGANNSYLRLTKMDSNYNVIWKRDFGGDANYLVTGIAATSDGGCIIYSPRHDHNNLQQVDVIVIKVDGNGLITSTNSIPITQASITAYPNPSTGQLNFKKEAPSVFERFEVSIFDISGKLVFQKKETDLSEMIDLTHLAEGNYMYQIQQQGIIKAIGEWVKIK
jgi:hypothetical protein